MAPSKAHLAALAGAGAALLYVCHRYRRALAAAAREAAAAEADACSEPTPRARAPGSHELSSTMTRLEPLNPPGAWDFFISHTQRNGDAVALATDLYHSLRERGKSVWFDVKMDDRSAAGMEEGVRRSQCVIAIITQGPDDASDYFRRPFCVNELRWALEAGVKVQPVVRVEDKGKIGDFMSVAPDDLKLLGSIDWLEIIRSDKTYFSVGVGKIIATLGQPPALGHGMAAPALATAGTATAAEPSSVVLSGGWPGRMGEYEFDGHNDGKPRYKNKSFPTWQCMVYSAKFGQWQIATSKTGGAKPLYVNHSGSQLPPKGGWTLHQNDQTTQHVTSPGDLRVEYF